MQVKSWKYMLQTSENYKLQQHSRANKKKKKLRTYFTIQIVKQNMPFNLWRVQFATYSMSVKRRHHSTLD